MTVKTLPQTDLSQLRKMKPKDLVRRAEKDDTVALAIMNDKALRSQRILGVPTANFVVYANLAAAMFVLKGENLHPNTRKVLLEPAVNHPAIAILALTNPEAYTTKVRLSSDYHTYIAEIAARRSAEAAVLAIENKREILYGLKDSRGRPILDNIRRHYSSHPAQVSERLSKLLRPGA
jgi:hypothetical protein